MAQYRYLHYDVFTSTRFEGNPLAVLPDARGLSTAQMQAITREIGFSETTFVLPPERNDTDVRMRIFTPAQELPMAGHPTIGTTFALAHEHRLDAPKERVVFGLGVGPTPVDLTWNGDALDFAWMTQHAPEFGTTFDELRMPIAAALGLDTSALAESPVQVVSSGVPLVFIPLRTRAAIDRATPDVPAIRRLGAEHGLDRFYLFTLEPGALEATTYSRMFAPTLGIAEDPATGGACGPLGGYLLRHGLLTREGARSIVNLQGVAMGRPSWIHIEVTGTPDEIGPVRVGGHSVLVASGTLEVD